MIWWSLRHSVRLFCHDMVKPQTLYQSVLSWYGEAPDIVSVCFVMIWTKQTDTMSEVWPYHDKTDWYNVWGLTISWQNRRTLCLRLDHIMTKQTDIMSEVVCFVMIWWSLRHSVRLFCHDMVKPQTLYQSVLSWYGEASDIVSVCFVMIWSNLRHCISLFCHDMVKPQT
jgi:hypothetical protein